MGYHLLSLLVELQLAQHPGHHPLGLTWEPSPWHTQACGGTQREPGRSSAPPGPPCVLGPYPPPAHAIGPGHDSHFRRGGGHVSLFQVGGGGQRYAPWGPTTCNIIRFSLECYWMLLEAILAILLLF